MFTPLFSRRHRGRRESSRIRPIRLRSHVRNVIALDERIVPDSATVSSFDSSTILTSGPRNSGANTFFNIEGDGQVNFECYSIADFNFAGQFGGQVTGFNSASITLRQSNAGFTTDGTYKVYVTADTTTDINTTAPAQVKYTKATNDGIDPANFTDRILIGTFNFVEIASGTIDTVTLNLAPAASLLAGEINGDGKIRLLFTPDNVSTPTVAATYSGASHVTDPPKLTIDAIVDKTVPIATIGALPPVLLPNVTSYPITVTFTDNAAIKVSTLDDFDIRVTGPGGFNQLAKFDSVDVKSDGTPRVAKYNLAAPITGTTAFDKAENGTYNVSIEMAQVTDVGGQAVAAGPLGSFEVAVDVPRSSNAFDTSIIKTTGPRGQDQYFNVAGDTTGANASYAIADFNFTGKFGATVTGFNSVKISLTEANAAFTKAGDFNVWLTKDVMTGINIGASPLLYLPGTLDGIAPFDFTDRIHLGKFNFPTTGNVNSGQVDTFTLDMSKAASLMAFEINNGGIVRILITPDNAGTPDVNTTWGGELAATPVLTIDATIADPNQPVGKSGSLANVTTSGSMSYTFDVTYTDDVAVKFASIGAGDVRVTGPGGYDQPGSIVKVTPMSDAKSMVVTYSIPSPGPAFDYTDNGAYTVTLQASAVEDTGGNNAPAGMLGCFMVAIANPLNFVVLNDADSGAGSLRKAVADANANFGPDSITFDSGFFGSAQTIKLTTGELWVTDSVKVLSPNVNFVTVSGESTSRMFKLYGGGTIDVTLDKLTLTQGSQTVGDGGAIWSVGENLTLTNSKVTGNIAVQGGAIQQSSGGKLIIIDSSISGNSTTSDGGGINVDAGVNVVIRRSTLSGNISGDDGAGLYLDGGTLLVDSSTISGNAGTGVSGDGGGAYLRGSPTSVIIRNSTISGNSTLREGGGIQLGGTFNGVLQVQNSTIVNNTAGLNGGGISEFSGTSTITLQSSIIALNNSSTSPDIFTDQTVQVSSSFVGVADTGFTITDQGGNSTGTFVSPADPMIDPLALNAPGTTQTHALKSGSPAIDAGKNVAGIPTDQRGVSRVQNVLAVPNAFDGTDMGAYEFPGVIPPPPTVSTPLVNGFAPGQMSVETSLKVTFNEAVSFPNGPAAAFLLVQTATQGAYPPGSAVGLTFSPADGPATSLVITFNNSGVVQLDPGGSLPDGTYQLTVVADNVLGVGGTLDGNGNLASQGSPIDDRVFLFHRLFGDSTNVGGAGPADGNVTSDDFADFRRVFGTAATPGTLAAAFDFNGNGTIDSDDFANFRRRFGLTGYFP